LAEIRAKALTGHRRRLAVAWFLMNDANDQAKQDPGVRQALTAISQRWGITEDDLLLWSFVPREVLALLRIKAQVLAEKGANARDIRQLRKLQAHHPEVYGENPELRGKDLRAHELRWWAWNFGLDKESADFSRQQMWGQVMKGVCDLIQPLADQAWVRWRWQTWQARKRPKPAQASKRAATRTVSQLLQARYPDLWAGSADRIRSRSSYKPRRRPPTA